MYIFFAYLESTMHFAERENNIRQNYAGNMSSKFFHNYIGDMMQLRMRYNGVFYVVQDDCYRSTMFGLTFCCIIIPEMLL